uniref:Uncharacterized protein n=1 Tax=Oryza meridionalis TaxID=40149 RepID=A0A0E0CE30_9ORYZ
MVAIVVAPLPPTIFPLFLDLERQQVGGGRGGKGEIGRFPALALCVPIVAAAAPPLSVIASHRRRWFSSVRFLSVDWVQLSLGVLPPAMARPTRWDEAPLDRGDGIEIRVYYLRQQLQCAPLQEAQLDGKKLEKDDKRRLCQWWWRHWNAILVVILDMAIVKARRWWPTFTHCKNWINNDGNSSARP